MSADIPDELQRIQHRIAELQAEIEELEIAARVIARIRGTEPSGEYQAGARKSGNGAITSIPRDAMATDAAAIALSVHDPKRSGVHYIKLADLANQMGWGGNAITLRRRMNKRKERFDSLGQGVYRLKNKHPHRPATSGGGH